MWTNYLKTAWMNLRKHQVFSLINIAGLSIGITVCIVIVRYVQYEWSFDRFNAHADRIARIVFNANMNGGKISESNVMPPVAGVMQREFPEVETATRLMQFGTPKVSHGTRVFRGNEAAFVDPNFFDVFTFQFISGNPRTALQQPHSVVITQAAAEKYFGREQALGKTLVLNDQPTAYRITGVIQAWPANAHFHFDLLASLTGWRDASSDSWMTSGYYTYLLLKKRSDLAALQAKLPGMVERYMGPQIQQQMGLTLSQFHTQGNALGFALQPLTAIHLHSHTTTELEPGGNVTYLYIFSAIALFMLLVACINFINLSTASASGRAKEVGVRKVIGGSRFALVKQFLLESALLVFVALGLSVLLIYVFLPWFNRFSGMDIPEGLDLSLAWELVILGVVVSLGAGLYPAFFLSSFRPIAVLKGKVGSGRKSLGLRSGLVVFQFFITVGLIIATLVVWQQMRYIQHKNLGYDKAQLLVLPNSYALGPHEEVFKQEMLRDPRVVNATVSSYRPAGPSNSNNTLAFPQGHDDQMLRAVEYHVDEQYIPTLGMQMASGRNFSSSFGEDSTAMVINESAARTFGWSNPAAVGKILINASSVPHVPYHIIGVVRDFNFKSLHEPITPLFMVLDRESGLIFKVHTSDIRGLLAHMKDRWQSLGAAEPFRFNFMDQLYNDTYALEGRTSMLLNLFAVLTILVACLGLFGLATYSAEQRAKEIGIRKVLGATSFQMVKMLSGHFLRLVGLACLVAFPLAYWAMHKWLQGFAYRINLSGWVFVEAAGIALCIAWSTVSARALKAAMTNPVKNLRTE
jgi:putative ABC transport system permease protein